MNIRKISFAVIWLVCSYFAHGLLLGYFTAKFPYVRHEPWCASISLGGPFTLAASLIQGATVETYRQTPLSKEERWAHYHDDFPTAPRTDFEKFDTQ